MTSFFKSWLNGLKQPKDQPTQTEPTASQIESDLRMGEEVRNSVIEDDPRFYFNRDLLKNGFPSKNPESKLSDAILKAGKEDEK